MAGSPVNAAQWANGDVFVATLSTDEPTDVTTAWDAAWKAVGLLDGEEGFTEERDEETSERYAWGGILVRKGRSKHKRTIKFVAMEDNITVFNLINPGSLRSAPDPNGVVKSTVRVPRHAEFAIGFESRDGAETKRRMVKRATLEEVGEVQEHETDVTVYEITVVLLPEADGTLYTELLGTDPTP